MIIFIQLHCVQKDSKLYFLFIFVSKLQVASVLEDGYSLSYMVQSSGNLYTWPQGDEVYFTHPQRDIICKLPGPEYVWVGSRLLNKMDLTDAERLFQKIEQ